MAASLSFSLPTTYDHTLEKLKLTVEEFNSLIDQAMAELDEMRSLAQQAGVRTLEVAADLQEVPYASVNQNNIRIRRRFDVRQG